MNGGFSEQVPGLEDNKHKVICIKKKLGYMIFGLHKKIIMFHGIFGCIKKRLCFTELFSCMKKRLCITKIFLA